MYLIKPSNIKIHSIKTQKIIKWITLKTKKTLKKIE